MVQIGSLGNWCVGVKQNKPFTVKETYRQPGPLWNNRQFGTAAGDKEFIVVQIEEILEESWEDIVEGTITAWDLANEIAVMVLK